MNWIIREITTDEEGESVWGLFKDDQKKPAATIQAPEELVDRMAHALNIADSADDAMLRLPDPPDTHYDIIFTPTRKKPAPKRKPRA
jgi:hypothetical protein